MREALSLAVRARDMGEVPVGAVVVLEDRVIGDGVQPADRRQRSHSSRRDRRHPGRREAHRQLPAPRGDAVCDDRAVPDVRGSDDPRQDRARRLRHDGTEGRGDRISDAGARAPVAESPDGSGRRPARSRMPRGDSGLFQVAPRRIATELRDGGLPRRSSVPVAPSEGRRGLPERSNKRLRPQASAGGQSPKATASAQRAALPERKVVSACGRKRAPEGSRRRRPRARSEGLCPERSNKRRVPKWS